VGGFIGLYSQLAPVELRVRDTTICAAHTEKSCYTGNAEGYGCPWQVFPGGLVKNTYCGTCMECLRTCPHDNIVINLRAPGADLYHPAGRKLDEAYKAFIMLGSALVYSAVLLGPWGLLKNSAYAIGSLAWFGYALTFLSFTLVFLPGSFWLAVAVGRAWAGRQALAPGLGRKKAFTTLAYALLPLGLAAWVAFSLSFVFTNLSYIWPALSDPLGLGWDLFGTAGLPWTPYLTGVVSYLQIAVLLGGLAWASRTARKIALQLAGPRRNAGVGQSGRVALRLALPVVAYCLAITAGLLVLLVG
jgi:hypothetical protein